MNSRMKWYVVHTYSGYENKVKANIEKIVENRNMQEIIADLRVPMDDVIEIKDDGKKTVKRKRFPGYVLVKMEMTDEAWYVIRNTRGVTGFVGPGSKPVPLSEEEVAEMGVERTTVSVYFEKGDSVRICSGPLENFTGTVENIDTDKAKVTVVVSMFGRNTPIELEYEQIEVVV